MYGHVYTKIGERGIIMEKIEIIMYSLIAVMAVISVFIFIIKRKSEENLSNKDIDAMLNELLTDMVELITISINVLNKDVADYPSKEEYKRDLYAIVVPKFYNTIHMHELLPPYVVPLITEENIIKLIDMGLAMLDKGDPTDTEKTMEVISESKEISSPSELSPDDEEESEDKVNIFDKIEE